MPFEKRIRFKTQYGLANSQINILVGNEKLAGFFENVVTEFLNWEKEGLDKDSLLVPELAACPHFIEKERQEIINLSANYLLSDFLGLLNEVSAEVDDTKITAENFAEWACLIHRSVITSRAAKDVLKEMWATGKDPSQIIKEKDLIQVQDTGELEKVAQKIINENEAAVLDYKKGKNEALQFLIGQIMRETRGKANPEIISEILKKILK